MTLGKLELTTTSALTSNSNKGSAASPSDNCELSEIVFKGKTKDPARTGWPRTGQEKKNVKT